MSLWQKPDQDENSPSTPATSPRQSSAPAASAPSAGTSQRGGKMATIGQSVQIRGELTGQEDLVIDGRIEGKISLNGHQLTIGPNGRIAAEVHAKSVQINGEVIGNVIADDKVEISPSGSVQGDITAPRVALADGSSFKGSIDMGNKKESSSGSPASINRDVPIAAATKS
jgi:cytoskeletal protein CcmA (bactofilin family)